MQFRILMGHVEAIARDQAHAAVADEGERAISIPLDLVEPLGVGERGVNQGGEHRRDARRHLGLYRAFELCDLVSECGFFLLAFFAVDRFTTDGAEATAERREVFLAALFELAAFFAVAALPKAPAEFADDFAAVLLREALPTRFDFSVSSVVDFLFRSAIAIDFASQSLLVPPPVLAAVRFDCHSREP